MSSAAKKSADHLTERKRALSTRSLRERSTPPHSGADCFHHLFEAQVERTPEAIALASRDRRLTYRELNAGANQLAHRLRGLGVGPEVLVGLLIERSVEMVIGLLGILKAGGAYVPLDSSYPSERLAWMLADSRVPVLVTQQALLERLPRHSAQIVCLDRDGPVIARQRDSNPDSGAAGDHLAYVIYTSGSTGKPKGTMIVHRGLANYLAWCKRAYAVAAGRGAPVHSSISFDLTITALCAPLCAGRRVDLLGEDLGVEQLAEALRCETDYSLVKITPAHLQLLSHQLAANEVCGRTRAFIIGGEQLTGEVLAFWQQRAPETLLVNEYGPTETVVGCCVYRVPSDERLTGPVPIGRPIANTRLYVLDEYLQPVPVGVVGELYVGGAGVARGYLNQPGLTAERFMPDPFGKDPGARLYKTGDLARYRSDGNLEYIGRADRQVKIRGFRIEPGEIEAVLSRHPAVREAVVEAREDSPGDRRLVAYVVLEPKPRAPEVEELRNFLRAKLPESMVPSAFVSLGALPLTPNGKVDRHALPAPAGQRPLASATFVAPRTPAEEVVASIWAALLGLERVGVHDNFFDLGGHSLLATQVVSRLREAFGVEVPLRSLFEAPTVAGLAERAEKARQCGRSAGGESIQPVERDRELPLSFAQEALWFLDQLSPGQPTFNVTGALRIKGPLDAAALERSFSEIVRRHEALRTTFVSIEGRPVQVVAPALDLPLVVVDLRNSPEEKRLAGAERLAVEESRRPFDLSCGPLVRATLIRLADEDNAVLLTMHHIVTDGWSFGIAAQELATLYESYRRGLPSPLPALAIQYADFACWQRRWLRGDVFDEHLGYWKRQLAGVTPLDLPTDRPRPAIRTARGALLTFELPETLSRQLQELSRNAGVTPFMTLLAAFQTLLHRYSGQDDIAVGSPIANRNRTETEGLVGYFVNMLALRTDLAGDPSFRELLGRVREVALGAFEHQDFPLEKLVETLQLPRDVSRTPLFQVMFVLQNNRLPDVGRQDLTLVPLLPGAGTGTAKFDLSLAMEETEHGLSGSLEYNTDLFDAETVARMVGHFQTLLAGISAHPETRLSQLPILTEDEQRRLLHEWSQPPAGKLPSACVHERFEAQVARSPEAVALVGDGERLTYRELNRRSNQLARHLRSLGVGRESLVGICVLSPITMVVGLLAVLKAGGAYVPLDPAIPRQRLKFMINDAGLAVLLTERRLRADLPQHGAVVVCLDSDWEAIGKLSAANLSNIALAENLAYLIFTSGSLGTPKGVSITHAGLDSVYQAWEEAYELRSETTCHLQMASFAFDVFTGDWVRALCTGATLVACPRDILLDPKELHGLIIREQVDCAEFVPAVVENLIAHLEISQRTLESMRLVVVGSDQWHAGDYERLRRLAGAKTRIVNSYGLTEATIDSLYFEGTLAERLPNRPVPIGRPLANTRVYLLDQNLQPVPVGVPGELHVGGSGLARGYHRRPRFTAEKFIPDSFSGVPGARLYKTGDLARWLPDGNVELIGRIDHQVKIRGFRVELAEVESALRQHADVRDAVSVVCTNGTGDKYLAAYLVPHPQRSVPEEELRLFLKERLPRYMIPSLFMTLETLPLTTSGKVDRQALPAPQPMRSMRQETAVGPRDAVESQLAEIWEQVLGIRPVGVTDNFFDLGGHSLLAVRLAAKVEVRFGRRLPLSTLFQGATIEELAGLLRTQGGPRAWSPLVPIRTTGSQPPFFCVHPIGGNVLCYHELARLLGTDRPVYGLQARGLDGEQEPAAHLHEMAARYVQAVRGAQPAGPYHVAGWSLGGVVAYEMAQQLRAQGHQVATLALIDCRAPAPRSLERPIDDAEILVAFAADLAHALERDVRIPMSLPRGFDAQAGMLSLFESMGLAEQVRSEIGLDRLQRFWTVFRANYEALARYAPRVYPGRLMLFRAGHRLVESVVDPTLGWKALAAGGVTTHVLPGDHYALLKPPAVEQLAEILRSEMSRHNCTT